MIDWFSGLIGYEGQQIHPNTIIELNQQSGEVISSFEKRLPVEGSYSSKIQVKPGLPNREMLLASEHLALECAPVCLELSGNPSKFLQGHNVFGPSVSSLQPVLTEVIRRFPAGIRPQDADSPLYPALHRTRLDITTTIDFKSHNEVHEYIHFLEHSSQSRHGRAQLSGETVYWGLGSRHWKMKCYCKFCELKEHLSGEFIQRDNLKAWTEGKLRMELELHTSELKNRGTLTEALIWDYFSKIGVSNMKKGKPVIPNLPRWCEGTYMKWQAGVEVRFTLPPNTYYRHRRAILKETGLDISLPYNQKDAETVNLDIEWLKAHEVKEVPEIFQGILFKPVESRAFKAHYFEEEEVCGGGLNELRTEDISSSGL
jgi:hypothetical protein